MRSGSERMGWSFGERGLDLVWGLLAIIVWYIGHNLVPPFIK